MRQPTKLRRWHLLPLVVAVLVVLNWQNIPAVWAEIFHRTPREAWCRTVADERLARHFPIGDAFTFVVQDVAVTREKPGQAVVKVTGEATTREPFYQTLSTEDPALGLEAKLLELRGAEARSQAIIKTAGVGAGPPPQMERRFVREAVPAGGKFPFEFHFRAAREGMKWNVGDVLTADVVAPARISGEPMGQLGGVVILGTDEANRQLADFSKRIDSYVAASAKRLIAEGRDASGNLLFPKDKPLPGERFPETRQRFLDASDVQQWPEEKLQYAINEIFARHGAEFGNKKLADWFGQFGWYKPSRGVSFEQIETTLSEVEFHNVKTLGFARVTLRENAVAAQQQAAQQRTLASQQAQQDAAAQRAQQEAARRAQQDAMAEQLIGGILQGISNGLRR